MNLVFLDIDGVLNSQNFFFNRKLNKHKPVDFSHTDDLRVISQMLRIDATCFEYVLKAVQETHSYVVIMSSIIALDYFDKIVDYFNILGLPVIGKIEGPSANRGEGVKKFVNTFKPKSYLLFDDEIFPSYDEELLNHLVKTSFYENGFEEKHYLEALEKFNAQKVFVKK